LYESAQEILVVMNPPPVGQLVVAYVPNKNQPNAEQIAHLQQ
jgi:hypothetical protein